MANNEIKTNAEIYREQRKDRLAKASKKKHSAKTDKFIRILVKTVCIILIVGVVLYGALNLLTNVFNTPQKVLTAATYGDTKVTVAQYNYYYMSLLNSYRSTAQQYEQMYSSYGAGYGAYLTGFDYNKDPAEQEYKANAEDAEADASIKTWSDFFKKNASTRAFLMASIYDKAMSAEAKEAGFEYTDDMKADYKKQIDETIESLQKYAKKNDFSLDNYIARTCGEGLNEKSYREYSEKDYIAQQYISWYSEHTSDELTDKEVLAYYKENIDSYAKASARVFSVSYKAADTSTTTAASTETTADATYTKAQAKALADEYLAKITDEASFATLAREYCLASQKDSYASDDATLVIKGQTKDSVKQTNESLANWLYNTKRVVGDKTVIADDTNSAYYVVYLTAVAAADKTPAKASVRHILVQAETSSTDDDGNTVALSDKVVEENFAKAKTEAESIYKTWKSGKATEDTFSALAKEKSDDSGSTENGGLYEDINSDSSYVDAFKSWSLDPSRKAGDTGIVKTEYGYHIMYFVSSDKTPKWESDVRSAISSETSETLINDIYDDIDKNAKDNDKIIDFFAKRTAEKITLSYKNSASSSSTGATATIGE